MAALRAPLLLVALVFGVTAKAQVSNQDLLMSLMASQPKLAASGPVEATAVFDPPAVRPGAVAVLRISFNALQTSIQWDARPPAPENLELIPGGKGQVLQFITTNLEPRTSFTFRAKPTRAGEFVVPEFTVTVDGKPVKVPLACLRVDPGAPASFPQQLYAEIGATNIYVGQAVPVRVISPAGPGGILQGLTQVELSGQGFIVDQTAARQRVETVQTPQGSGPAFSYETILTPITAGKLSLVAQAYTVGNRFSGAIVITGPVTFPGGPIQYTLIDSEPLEFRAKPLPRAGQLPGFTGGVGSYTVDTPKLASAELRVGDPVRMTVVVRGDGSLSRLVPPPLPKLPNWQVFLGTNDNLPPQLIQAQGFARLNFTLVPISEQVKETPAIPFSCFDPVKGTYSDLTIASVPVTVKPGNAPVDLGSLARAGESGKKEKEPVLSGLAPSPGMVSASLVPLQLRPWFHFVQIAPAVLFLGLWGWDRRRRHLKAHPDILLRRRARRALRRERRRLHRAVRAGDADAFVGAAANGFRVACAPHYPAEPRALVCADVLPLLSEGDRNGSPGEAVRRVFEIDDASRFAGEASRSGNLLKFQTEIEAVFDKLREKL